MSVAADLARALALDGEALREVLVRAWVAMPCERLSRLVELVDAQRGAVLPYALANLGSVPSTRAPGVLAAIGPDPRVAPELLDLFAHPPWRSNPSLAFWRMACERIVWTRDPRILARLEQLALAYPRRIPSSVGVKVAGYLAKAARELRAAIEALPALDAACEAACAALEARLGAPPAPPRSRGAVLAADLLAAVYEAPADDGPREVLADHLMQRGDPYGDFIALQLARAQGRADDLTRARELELLVRSDGAWAGRIGMAIEAARFVYRRGFLAYVQLPRTRQTLAAFVDERAWSTVETFDVTWTAMVKRDREALTQILHASPGVRAVVGVPTAYLGGLDDRVLAKLERIEVELGDPADLALVTRWLAVARRPRSLSLRPRGADDLARADVEAVVAAARPSQLARLEVSSHQPQSWLALLERSGLPVIAFAVSLLHVELAREGERYPRAVVWQHALPRGSGFPEVMMRHFAELFRDRTFVVDARTPFYPGMTVRPLDMKRLPQIEGIVDDITLLGR